MEECSIFHDPIRLNLRATCLGLADDPQASFCKPLWVWKRARFFPVLVKSTPGNVSSFPMLVPWLSLPLWVCISYCMFPGARQAYTLHLAVKWGYSQPKADNKSLSWLNCEQMPLEAIHSEGKFLPSLTFAFLFTPFWASRNGAQFSIILWHRAPPAQLASNRLLMVNTTKFPHKLEILLLQTHSSLFHHSISTGSSESWSGPSIDK